MPTDDERAVFDAICAAYGIRGAQLLGRSRAHADARLAAYLLLTERGASGARAAMLLGRHHTTFRDAKRSRALPRVQADPRLAAARAALCPELAPEMPARHTVAYGRSLLAIRPGDGWEWRTRGQA